MCYRVSVIFHYICSFGLKYGLKFLNPFACIFHQDLVIVVKNRDLNSFGIISMLLQIAYNPRWYQTASGPIENN